MNMHPVPISRRRAAITLVALAGAASLPAGAQTADFPTRGLRFVVNFPPGGPIDLLARIVAARLTTTLKQSVVVENLPGASGAIGAAAVVRAQPDGHTVMFTIDTPLTVTPVLSPDSNFKPEDLKPVTMLGMVASTLVVPAAAGNATSLADLIARGKRDPINFATAGIGTPGHFGAELFSEATGVKINPIHYRGNAPAVTALVAGEVHAGILSTGSVSPHVASGKLRAFAVAGTQRSALLPDVPTTAEAGVQGAEMQTGLLVMAPLRVPDATMVMLRDAIIEATRQRDWIERMRAFDAVTNTMTPRETADWLSSATERYRRIVKATGMKAE